MLYLVAEHFCSSTHTLVQPHLVVGVVPVREQKVDPHQVRDVAVQFEFERQTFETRRSKYRFEG
jgi:hypothetical protein